MKKILFVILVFVSASFFAVPASSWGQSMVANNGIDLDSQTDSEEIQGKIVWDRLQAKQVQCSDLSDGDFEVLGEYIMGQMIGVSHETMNIMMEQMMGKEGEEQMHIVMGRRLSSCDTSAAIPSQGVGFMPMMQMMMGGWSSPTGFNQTNPGGIASRSYGAGNPMMNFGFTPFGSLGWFFMILWWVLIIVGAVALIKWLMGQSRNTRDYEKSPLEILKERYARGEIDKEEYNERKKDLS